jgi:glucosylceramidase
MNSSVNKGPPAWMKTQMSSIGGSLRNDAYSVYAKYFVKYIQAYQVQNIGIYAITVQNEPLYAPSNYPGMLMSNQEQADFIGNYLGPALARADLKTKIIAYDHNYDNINYAESVCNDQKANGFVTGAGFHHYVSEGSEANILGFHAYDPTKEMWITEAGFGTWMGNNLNQFQNQMIRLIKTSRYWSKGNFYT